MRNILKKAAAVVLSAALCLSFAGCYDEGKSWAAKMGDDTMPIGGYIYYLNSAYSEAREKISSGEEVLKATIEDRSAESWISDRALEYLKSYFYVSSKCEELGLTLTEEDLAAVEENTSYMWSYMRENAESMGIAKESFDKAYSLYNARYQKLMEAMYGEGGELEIPEEELKSYFTENYYDYEFFYVPLSTTDEEGNSTDLTDEEKEDLRKKLEDYADEVSSGKLTVEEAATAYAQENAVKSGAESSDSEETVQNNYSSSTSLKDNLSTTIKDALEDLDEGKATFVENSNTYYVIRKLPIADKFGDYIAEESQKTSLIGNMKGEDFHEFVLEQGGKLEGLTINDRAISGVKLSKVVNDSNKNGASSEASGASSEAAE